MKRLHVLLATLALLCTTGQAWGQTVIASGECGAEGDNLTWTLTNGTLTISGEGDMADYYSYDKAPWYYYREAIRIVVIADGVTSIGDNSLCDCSNLTSVGIPNSVTSIGDAFLSECVYLTSVDIPDGVMSIGDSLLYECSNLTSVDIPDGVTSIGNYFLYGCSSLTSVNIPNGLTGIGDNFLWGCGSLTSVDIPDGVASIGDGFLLFCSHLTSVDIPDGVTSIGDAFLRECSSLTSVNIPKSVTSIGINALEETALYEDKSNWTNGFLYIDRCLIRADNEIIKIKGVYDVVVVPDTRLIADGAFSGCNSLTSVSIPESVMSIGDEFLSYCSSLTSVDIPESVVSIGNNFLYGCNSLTSVNIPDEVTNIGDRFLCGCSGLTSVDIPNGVTSIGNSFLCGSSLTSIDIPNGVTSIGDDFLYGCSGLTSIDIPDGVTSIGDSFLAQCDSLTSVRIGSGLETAGTGWFEGTPNLEEFICKSVVAQFPVNALHGKQKIHRLEGPVCLLEYENNEDLDAYTTRLDSVVIIGGTVSDKGFAVLRQSAGALQTLSLEAADNAELPTLALDGCIRLRNLTLPASLAQTGYGAFKGCTALASVTLPATLVEVDDRAFEDCRSLTSVQFDSEGALERIGNWAFYNCHQLQTLQLPEGVAEVGLAAFYGCSYLEDIELPSTLRSIGDHAFAHNTKARKMTVHAAVPPVVEAKTFLRVSRDMPVYVPAESLASYQAAAYWQDLNLQPIGDATGMGHLSLSENITVVNGEVHIINMTGTGEVQVYDLQGRSVLRTTESRFVLPQGIYIIKVGDEALKVAI